MHIARAIEAEILRASKSYHVLSLLGPRQSGKTTLSRFLFPQFKYINLEHPETRQLALADPKALLSANGPLIVFDEIQRVPELLSYIQVLVDEENSKWRFIITGSQSLEISKKISQTLAGRTRIFKILPLTLTELQTAKLSKDSLDEQMLYGCYPRIYSESLDPSTWLSSYFETYVEKDVRQLMNIKEMDEFNRFIRLCAGRIGQLVNYSQLGNEAGVTQPTAQSWLGLLRATFVLFTLAPHHKNFNKQVIKTPKLYFYDTGLLCYLLRIKTTDQLFSHPLRGQIFENLIVAEYTKTFFNQGEESPLYFWRDKKGHEVDLILDQGNMLFPIEIKSSTTFNEDFLKNIHFFNSLQKTESGRCVYGGENPLSLKGIEVVPWKAPIQVGR